jgi:Ca2+-binding RTX toxin-like protein
MLFGGTGSDQLTGGLGNDELTGGQDSDTFMFRPMGLLGGFGDDTVTDFQAGAGSEDVLVLSGFGYQNLQDILAHSYSTAAGTVIEIDAGSITLLGVEMSDLHADDFLFL